MLEWLYAPARRKETRDLVMLLGWTLAGAVGCGLAIGFILGSMGEGDWGPFGLMIVCVVWLALMMAIHAATLRELWHRATAAGGD